MEAHTVKHYIYSCGWLVSLRSFKKKQFKREITIHLLLTPNIWYSEVYCFWTWHRIEISHLKKGIILFGRVPRTEMFLLCPNLLLMSSFSSSWERSVSSVQSAAVSESCWHSLFLEEDKSGRNWSLEKLMRLLECGHQTWRVVDAREGGCYSAGIWHSVLLN